MARFDPLPEPLSTIILNAVKEHHRQLGIGTLALVLKGSKNKLLQNRKLYNSNFFGALFYYSIDTIENFIKQLIEQKMITVVQVTGNPYPLPLLELSEEGKLILSNKINLPLELKRNFKPVVLNDSTRETLRVFLETKDIPKTSRIRNLAESTIWKHLTDLVKLGQLSAGEIVEKEKMQQILELRNELPEARLKELKEKLPEDISYEEIRCVLAEGIKKVQNG
ncbi:MAG: helix-turn-helix domain-containing protein [Nanoarchaeota archaeon]